MTLCVITVQPPGGKGARITEFWELEEASETLSSRVLRYWSLLSFKQRWCQILPNTSLSGSELMGKVNPHAIPAQTHNLMFTCTGLGQS